MIPPSPEQIEEARNENPEDGIARKIVIDRQKEWVEEDGRCHLLRLREIIAAALRSYGEACVKEERDTHWNDWEQVKQEARHSALEEAVKVAEEHANFAYIGDAPNKAIAEKIRALLPSSDKTSKEGAYWKLESQLSIAREALKDIVEKRGNEILIAKEALAALDGKAGEGK